MSAHLRVNLSSLLPEPASCDARAAIPCGDVGNDGHDLPMSSDRENAAVADVVGADKYVDVVKSSSIFRANAGFEYERSLSEKL